jgi:uncharacterized membrane protein YheB (UPF0754 family)
MNEAKSTLNNNILNYIEQIVITKVLRIMSTKIYNDYNNSIMNYINEEIKIRKKNKIDINIKNLGNMSDDEMKKMKIKTLLKRVLKKRIIK